MFGHMQLVLCFIDRYERTLVTLVDQVVGLVGVPLLQVNLENEVRSEKLTKV
jgi:hypothetical protein